MPTKILWVDDNETHPLELPLMERLGPYVEVIRAYEGSEALKLFEANRDDLKLVLVDLRLPNGTDPRLGLDIYQQMPVGQRVAVIIRSQSRDIPILAYATLPNAHKLRECVAWFKRHSEDWASGEGFYLNPGQEKLLIDRLVEKFAPEGMTTAPRVVLMIHGHDRATLDLLVKCAKEKLGFETLIFSGEPQVDTNIQHFEDLTEQSDFAFVILTPDDCGFPKADPLSIKARARQNVIFELGYLVAMWGRTSKRIVVFIRNDDHARGELEIPSDLLATNRIRLEGTTISDATVQKIKDLLQPWIGKKW